MRHPLTRQATPQQGLDPSHPWASRFCSQWAGPALLHLNSQETVSATETANHVKRSLPEGGLFAGHHWRIATVPFTLDPGIAGQLEKLGRVLLKFYKVANLLYHRSADGRLPAWAAHWLDLGKPADLVALQRSRVFHNGLPRVIRPDVLLTGGGLRISELDSIPGGIGLTAWLNQVYARAGLPVLGGERGMLEGFAGIFDGAPGVHIMVSEESATYRPEMEWLAGQLGGSQLRVRDTDFTGVSDGDAVYRFFELFDLENIPASGPLFDGAAKKRFMLTPPPKAFLEEKLLFALFWNRNLQEFWIHHLGERFFKMLREMIPQTWVVDPSPMPPHTAVPGLGLTDWRQLGELSQKDRQLILKVSGFSAQAWGARGVWLGSDLSREKWSLAVEQAIREFDSTPRILQRYHKPMSVTAEWFDFETDQPVSMRGRVRLCPYYFVKNQEDTPQVKLGGVLATICPADKKIIHGMSNAILAPCAASS